MSRNAEVNKIFGLFTLFSPFLTWVVVAKKMEYARVTKPKIKGIIELIPNTFEHPLLYIIPIVVFILAIIAWILAVKLNDPDFKGYKYDYRLRGSEIVSAKKLNELTTIKNRKQAVFATIKMPLDVENLQTLIVGATGSAKTLILTYAIYSILLRGDRQIIVDPDGTFLSMFYKDGDVILNPFDARSPGWSIFNEFRELYDFDTYSYSLVPLGKSSQEEEWNGYGRLLVCEVAKKLHENNNASFDQLFDWCLSASEEDLEEFCKGTRAEALFIGTDKTIGSARFVLSNKLSSHMYMPDGDFSLRDWLADDTGGNLYITWTEDQVAPLKPLISTFVDVICNAILSLPVDPKRIMWLHTDELATLDKLNALMPSCTKGRKKGLRIVSCIQAMSQLDSIWGKDDAITLRSCYRNLIALGGARSDEITPEILSKALGELDIVRKHESKTQADRSSSRNNSERGEKDRLVTAAEISNLPDRQGYVAFTRGYPVARVTVPITNFKIRHEGFVPRKVFGG